MAIEIVLTHLYQGEVVTLLDLSSQFTNSCHSVYVGKNLREKFPSLYPMNRLANNLKRKFPAKFEYITNLTLSNFKLKETLNLEVIKDAVFKDLVSESKEFKPNLKIYAERYEKKKKDFIQLYQLLLNFLDDNFKYVYTYNGRFLNERALWEACKTKNIKIKFHDRFVLGWTDKYWIWESHVHDTKYRAQVVRRFSKRHEIKSMTKENEIRILNEWMQNREKSISQPYTSFQQENFKKNNNQNTLVSFFTSSEDELIYTNLKSLDWPSQITTVRKLIKFFKNENVEFIVRVHPNLQHKSKKTQLTWLQLKEEVASLKNIKVILPLEKIKSYDILNESDVVITSGSTVGVEAVLRNKPTFLLGKSLYDGLSIGYKSKNQFEFKQQFRNIETGNFKVNSREAKNYVYFLEFGGIRIRHGKIKSPRYKSNKTIDPEVIFFNKFSVKISNSLKLMNRIFER